VYASFWFTLKRSPKPSMPLSWIILGCLEPSSVSNQTYCDCGRSLLDFDQRGPPGFGGHVARPTLSRGSENRDSPFSSSRLRASPPKSYVCLISALLLFLFLNLNLRLCYLCIVLCNRMKMCAISDTDIKPKLVVQTEVWIFRHYVRSADGTHWYIYPEILICFCSCAVLVLFSK
jgi:hypothetical protein